METPPMPPKPAAPASVGVSRRDVLNALVLAGQRPDAAEARALADLCAILGFAQAGHGLSRAWALAPIFLGQGQTSRAVSAAAAQVDLAARDWTPAGALLRSAAREMAGLATRRRAEGTARMARA
jgi:hypothetical protein